MRPPPNKPARNNITVIARKIQKRTKATLVATPAMWPKPNSAAIKATIRKIKAHLSIFVLLLNAETLKVKADLAQRPTLGEAGS